MGLLIEGHDIDHVFDLVSRTEKQLGVWGGSRRSTYRRVGSWLIEQQYLASFLLPKWLGHPQIMIPDIYVDFSIKGFLKAIKRQLVSQKLVSRTSAQVIRIKSNIRTFYVNTTLPFSAKLLIGNTRTVEDMKNEITARSSVARYNTLRVPEILQYDMEHEPPFFCEEIISGRRPDPLKDAAIICHGLCPQLWQTYEAQGITLRTVQNEIDSANALETLHRACNAVEWDDTWCDKRTFISKAVELVESSSLVPYTIGHGDLGLGNMILGPDKQIYIVDWESARERPIMFDLWPILRKIPQARQYIASRFKDFISQNAGIPILPFRVQVFLSALLPILRSGHVQEVFCKTGTQENSLQGKLFEKFNYANSVLSWPENLI